MENNIDIQRLRLHLEQIDIDIAQNISATNISLESIIYEYNKVFSQLDPANQIIPDNIIVKPVVVHDDIPCEWIYPKNHKSDHRILYIHGGGWCNANFASFRALVARIAESSGFSVLLLNYRVAPEHPFTAGLSDCLASYTKMLISGPESTSVARRSFIAGDTTGANMLLALMFLLRQRNLTLPDAAILLSPITNCDYLESNKYSHTYNDTPLLAQCYRQHLKNIENSERHLISPVHGDLTGIPDLLIQASTSEIVFEDTLEFVNKAKISNVNLELQTWAEVPHSFQRFAPSLRQANDAIKKIGSFLKQYENNKVIAFPDKPKIKQHGSSIQKK